jgi:hypothetical protein
MTHTRPTPERSAEYRAAAQALRVWFCDLLLWLAEFFGDSRFGVRLRAQVREDIADARRELRMIVILLALSNGAVWRNAGSPDWAYGDRPEQRMDFVRQLTRGIRFRGRNLRDHIARMLDVVDNLDAHVAKVARRMARLAKQRAPKTVRPSVPRVQRVADCAPVPPASAGPVLETGPPS